jgi:hypothetical protein
MRVQNEEIGEDQYGSLSNHQPFELSFRDSFYNHSSRRQPNRLA